MSEAGKMNFGQGARSLLNQAQKAADSKEYLVEGAKLFCVNGSNITQLKLPTGHGYTSGGKKKVNCKDCKACENIPYFGECRKNEKDHKCEGFMDLVDKWENTAVGTGKAETVGGEEAISMSSVLLCKKGGVIIPVSSGQGYDGKINWAAFLKRYQNVFRWVAGKNMLCQVYGKDPINMNTGNYIYEKEDLVINGNMPLSFQLFYNAMDCGDQQVLGEGWNHNYGVRLIKIKEEELLGIVLEDGRELPYCRKLGDSYAPVMGDGGILSRSENGYQLETEDGTVYEFDQEGKLYSQKDRNGNKRKFTYNSDGLLECVDNGTGGRLNYTYNKERKLIYVEDHTGRKISLIYQYGKLRWFTNSMGNTYTYEYNENGKLNGIITPRDILGVKNEYDGADRVRKQILPDGGVTEFRYDDENNRTYMLEQNGSLVIYESDKRMRNVRTIYEDGEEIFEYNDRNQKIRFTDKNGNTTRYSYDNQGNLTQVVNALGQKTNMTYDINGKLICIKQQDGACSKRRYDKSGNLVEVENPNGNITHLNYDDKKQLESILYPDGSKKKLCYDSSGNVTCMIDSMENMIQYEYDILNRVSSTTDGNGNITRFFYNEKNDIVKTINPMGYEKEYKYNPSGKVIAIMDYDGSTQKMWYNSCNRPERYEDQEGNTTEYQYDQMGNPISVKLPNGGEINLTYDKSNRLIQHEDAVGGQTKFAYDACGNQVQIKDVRGKIINYHYDALSRVIEESDSLGMVTHYEYDVAGNLARIIDPAGNWKQMEYDASGRKIKETDIRGNITTFCYNSMGKLISVKDAIGRTTSYEYYPGGLLKKVNHPDGKGENYIYDGNRNILEKWDSEGYRIRYYYDCQNRIISIKSNDSQKKSYSYDTTGNITSVTDANGNTTKYSYSPAGRLMSAEDAKGNLTRYGYDALGNVTVVFRTGNQSERHMELEEAIKLNQIQHSLHLTFYERDLTGRILSVTNPLGNKEQYEYDAAGNVLRKTDRDGYCTSFSYTIDGQIESITYDNGDQVEYSYDPLRQLKEVKDWLGITIAEYDSFGRIQKITDHRGQSIAYEFGDLDERKAIVYPDGSRTEYAYDNLLRMKEVRCRGRRVNYQYDQSGRLSERSCNNGLTTFWNYDHAGRLTELIHKKDDTVLENYQYTYDRMENKTEIRKYRKGVPEESGKYRYHYDHNGRMAAVEKDGQTLREYAYDAFNNRTVMLEGKEKTEYSYNAADQMIQKTGRIRHIYDYDLRGNLTEIRNDSTIEHEYTYDAIGRLSMAASGSGKKSSCYVYNGLGRRVGKTEKILEAKSSQTEYLLDMTKDYNDLLAAESGGKRQNYLWGKFLEGMEEGGLESFALLDEMGSPVRFQWHNGNDIECYGYDEFGCDMYGNAGKKQPFSYTGYLADEVSGTYFAQAREYIPEIGRFGGEDILKGYLDSSSSLNSYIYCLNSPLNFIDFLGNESEYWIVLMEQGGDAHKTLKTKMTGCPGLVPEALIPDGLEKGNGSGYSTPSGSGRADYIYYNAAGQIEVYELKHDTAFGRTRGQVQLGAYINAINNNKTIYDGEKAVEGYSLNSMFNCSLPSLKYPKKMINYHTDPSYPGMIFWSYDDRKKQPQEALVALPKDALEWAKNAGLVVGAVGLTAFGLALFADDATGFGVLDNGFAVALITKAAQIFTQVFGSCPAIN